MKIIRVFVLSLILTVGTTLVLPTEAIGQCAMCSLNAENSTQHGNNQGKGLNDGIFFLLAMPFLIGGGVAYLWYTKFRHKESKSSIL